MRFLCLHGKGTSARIFQSQTAAFRKLLPDTFEFDFIDGPFPDSAAAGIDLFYPPPYYKLYEHFTLESIKKGHQWLLDYVKEHGPYDGVMNFSQGCSLVSSLLLYQQAQQPSQPPLFKVAIFICGGVPLDVVEELGVNVTQEARDWDSSSKAQLEARASSAAILREGRERWGAGFDSLDSVPSSSSSEAPTTAPTNIFGIDFSLVKPELRIRIPTVHVYGARDPRFPASVTLAHFCDSSMRRTFDHGAGHEIPRARPVSERLAELLEWAAMMADRW